MKTKFIILLATSILFCLSWKTLDTHWLKSKQNGYSVLYTSADQRNLKEYNKLIKKGVSSVKTFFNSKFKQPFEVCIHPNRKSLDSTWQKDWKMTDFKSECWMVASGVSTKLDVISPKMWETESCEHQYKETNKTQQLITHELVHVFHGQHNVSPDFSAVDGIDWFVEGLATFASGQCNQKRIDEVKKAINENTIPKQLDTFWTGKYKYGISGSMVMFIDHKYGREKLKSLLSFNKKAEILTTLNITEIDLITEWKDFILNL